MLAFFFSVLNNKGRLVRIIILYYLSLMRRRDPFSDYLKFVISKMVQPHHYLIIIERLSSTNGEEGPFY